MAEKFANAGNSGIMLHMVDTIVDKANYLSELDGVIGDGDHGVNMRKGFMIAGEAVKQKGNISFTESLAILGDVLFSQIGGSMGPLYGMLFSEMSEAAQGKDDIDVCALSAMLDGGVEGIRSVSGAKIGDKTLLDVLVPSADALRKSANGGENLSEALTSMRSAAEEGLENTKGMIAKVGRASRLGERSRGVCDPGATSSCFIIKSLADGILDAIRDI